VRPYLENTHNKKRASPGVQVVSACLASMRSIVQTPVPQKKKKEKEKEKN
jgi:hypothetical protein